MVLKYRTRINCKACEKRRRMIAVAWKRFNRKSKGDK